MTHATERRMRASPHKNASPRPDCDLAPGTIVYTLDGALPVEYLNAGDRIITRAGARVLRGISAGVVAGGTYRLHFDSPQIIYADGMEVTVPA